MSTAKKSLGQHFLMHARIAERIALSAQLSKESVVLEIGPGKGMLTRELLKLSDHVIAVEADADLVTFLTTEFAGELESGKLTLVHEDVRSFDLSTLPETYSLVANIPYYITGDILRMFLETEHQPSSMTLLVQKEVAVRIARSKKESILSLSVKAYGVPKIAFNVPRGAFTPPPNVDSAVLTINDISRKNFSHRSQEEHFFALLHAGFAHKRKLVRNNLESAGFSSGNIPEKARAEDLPLAEWLLLTEEKNQPQE